MFSFYYRCSTYQLIWYKNSKAHDKLIKTFFARSWSGLRSDSSLGLGPDLEQEKATINGISKVPIAQHYKHFASDSSISYNKNNMENKNDKVSVNKEELKKRLTPLQYQVTQEAATERPFTGCYNKHYEKGIYQCIVCHQDLFSSDTKYDSGCGWPAFNDVLDKGKVTLHRDASIPGMVRTEVRCSKCSAHMGHVFDDGPPPKYLRYCINSASIDFVPQPQSQSQSQSQSTKSSNVMASGSTILRRNSQQQQQKPQTQQPPQQQKLLSVQQKQTHHSENQNKKQEQQLKQQKQQPNERRSTKK